MKPYVICHMMPSVDGRLRTDRWDVPKKGHEEYERTANTYRADAWLCGRKTMEEFANGRRLPKRSGRSKIPRDDFAIPRERGQQYVVVIKLSVLLAPVADGRQGEPALFDVKGEALEELSPNFGSRR
jgi:hypothetical protein